MTTTAAGPTATGNKPERVIEWLIFASSAAFIVILALAAVFDPSIRVLHVLEAFIYIAVMVLAGRRSAWGYGAGFTFAAFWNWMNLVHTTFIKNGVQELMRWTRTGQLRRPDLFIALPAATAHFVLIAACVAGYFFVRQRTVREAMKFWAAGLLAVAYFVVIIILTGPQYIPLLKRVFGL
jgi:hypothetical protein